MEQFFIDFFNFNDFCITESQIEQILNAFSFIIIISDII